MEQSWLRRKGGAEVIVIFGGWAVGSQVFDALAGEQDLLFVEDYRDLSDDLPELGGYDRRNLVAWSFGVASYGHWQAEHAQEFDTRVAINGTLTPVDRQTGVPPEAMQKTMDTLSEDSFQLFLSRCFNARQPFHAIDAEARRAELAAVLERGAAPDTRFDRIWISDGDRIFPPANMQRGWAGQANAVRRINGAHAPFDRFAGWEAMLQ